MAVQEVRVVNKPAEAIPTAAQGVTGISGDVRIVNDPTVHMARSTLEYTVEELPNMGNPGGMQAMTTKLNQLGKQGWDFMLFVPHDTANKNTGLFKRIA